MNVQLEIKKTIKELSDDFWEPSPFHRTQLRIPNVGVPEHAGINDEGLGPHFYLKLSHENQMIGRANAYLCRTDFATFENELSPFAKKMMIRFKSVFPDILAFQLLECGYFTTIGEGIEVDKEENLEQAVAAVARQFEEIPKSEKVHFMVFRDIPLEKYDAYWKALKPFGYLPTTGFANAVLPVEWETYDDFLKSVNSKTRLKLKNSLKHESKFDVRYEIHENYDHLVHDIANLWSNVNESSMDYSREILDHRFFAACSQRLKGKSELLAFYHQDKMIACMFNVYGEDDYFVMDWGVDYDFVHYKKANLYRAATLYSVQRAIELKKKLIDFGITNYVPKKLLGAQVYPLVYFVKHARNKVLGFALARAMLGQIAQPEFKDFFQDHPGLKSFESYETYIREAQKSDTKDGFITKSLKSILNKIL